MEDPDNALNTLIFYGINFISFIFFLEAICKSIAYGIIFNGKYSYLRENWNQMEFSLVVFWIISKFFPENLLFKRLTIFRVLRPLHLISKLEGVALIWNSLVRSIPQAINLLMVCYIAFLAIGILMVSQFKGRMQYCDYSNLGQNLIS